MPRKIARYGWRPDTPDFRDFSFEPTFSALEVQPPKVDLRPHCPTVYDQKELGSCHTPDTEVLTEQGWKLFASVDKTDRLASVNPITHELIFEFPTRIVCLDYVGDMYYGSHRALDFAVTANHKMLVRKWNENNRTLDAQYKLVDMKNVGWYTGLMNHVKYDGLSPSETYTLPGVNHKQKPQRESQVFPMSLWLRFLGIYLAEGTMLTESQYASGGYKIQIAAVKEREKLFVRTLLNDMGLKALELKDRFTFSNKRIYKELESLGLKSVKCYDKFVPKFIFGLSGSQIKDVLYGHFIGDGCEQDGHVSHYTSSKQLADDLQLLIILSGNWATIGERAPRTSTMSDGRVVTGRHPEYRVGVWTGQNLSITRQKNLRVEHYEGAVYCAEVPTYHTLVTRRNGKVLISGNCTSNAIGFGYHFLVKDPNFMPSRLFIYYGEREMEGTVSQDAGAEIRDGMKFIATTGVATEATWPYVISRFARKPVKAAYTSAEQHRAIKYYRVNQNLADIKSCLIDGFPIMFGFTVYENFESDEVAQTGKLTMPTKDMRVMGGHAVCAAGFDDSLGAVIVRNSWGDSWGDKGYFYMPYDYITNPQLADDFWTLRTITG